MGKKNTSPDYSLEKRILGGEFPSRQKTVPKVPDESFIFPRSFYGLPQSENHADNDDLPRLENHADNDDLPQLEYMNTYLNLVNKYIAGCTYTNTELKFHFQQFADFLENHVKENNPQTTPISTSDSTDIDDDIQIVIDDEKGEYREVLKQTYTEIHQTETDVGFNVQQGGYRPGAEQEEIRQIHLNFPLRKKRVENFKSKVTDFANTGQGLEIAINSIEELVVLEPIYLPPTGTKTMLKFFLLAFGVLASLGIAALTVNPLFVLVAILAGAMAISREASYSAAAISGTVLETCSLSTMPSRIARRRGSG